MATCLERTDLFDLLYVMFSCVFVTFSYGALVRVWYLIVSIPDHSSLLCGFFGPVVILHNKYQGSMLCDLGKEDLFMVSIV